MRSDPTTGSTTTTDEQRREAFNWLATHNAQYYPSIIRAMLAEQGPRDGCAPSVNDGSTAPLLPCPFCGDSALLQGLGEHNVICTNCNVLTPDFATAAEAIAAWNCRQGGTSAPVDLQQRLDCIEARQIVLYQRVSALSHHDAKAWLTREWNAVTGSKGE